MTRALYDYQDRAIHALRQAFNEVIREVPAVLAEDGSILEPARTEKARKVVLEAPTGAGKTVIASEIIRLFRGRQPMKRVIFTVPLISLIDQTVERFRQHGLRDIGVMQAKHAMTDKSAMIQVCSVQTLNNRDLPEDVSLVLVDECHIHSEAVPRMMAAYPDAFFVGFSATPWAKGMGLLWDRKVQVTTIGELIGMGRLSKFAVYAPDVPDMTGVKTKAGDYDEAGSAEVMKGKGIMGSVVQTWLEKADNRPTLLFGVNRAHAKELQEAFIRAGVSAGYCDAWTDIVERRRLAEQFASGEIKIACSVRTLTTGVDWEVSCIVDAAPTKSEMLHVQKIGRGLRVNPGTEDCLVLDHAGNSLRLGLVTDIAYGDLSRDPRKAAERNEETKEKLPKPCPACAVLFFGNVCPACGHQRKPFSGVEYVDGKLVELTPRTGRAPTMQEKQVFYGGLLWIAGDRGYRPGWAANQYKEKFGVWPRGLSDTPQPPTQAVQNYVKSRAIAWANRRKEA
jgi:superfamily II DNA or RNA helicase